MRMRKIVEAKERPTLEAAAKEFLAIKQAQMLSDETMHDYQAQLERFVCGSRNSTEYSLLEQDTLAFLPQYLIPALHAITNRTSRSAPFSTGWCGRSIFRKILLRPTS